MKVVLKVILSFALILLAMIVFAFWKPVTASKTIWPVVENYMLEEPFLGITANGTIEPDLFRIESTGVSTQPVVAAANDFIASLNETQRGRLLFPVDDLEWRRWANIHISTRQGVGLLEMNEHQSRAAMELLAASLSARGLKTSRDIMRLEGHLADLMDDHEQYGEKRYWFTIMGEPSMTEPWGWQIDGHHLIINYFLLRDQVVVTPMFMGSEPISATTGRFAGTTILEEELTAGLTLINSLDEAQRSVAIVKQTKTTNDNRGELFQDNTIVEYAGISLEQLTSVQRERARELIALYIGNLSEGHAEIKLSEIDRHWNATRFAWVGGTDPTSIFYYRIHSPVVMIEYDHQKPVALDGPDLPSQVNVHTVVRTPNGNDYVKELQSQHLIEHAH
ncbi:MAG: DUF3500 domain-containing protein [Pseudomonadales bacterium]